MFGATLFAASLFASIITETDEQPAVGGSGVVAAAGTLAGLPLAASATVRLPVGNAALVFVDARVAGEGVSFTVGQ